VGPDNNVATFIGFGYTGTAHYRAAMPAGALREGLFIRDDQSLEVKREIGIRNAPVIVYSQPWLDFQLAECAQILDGGGKLIIDVDDDLRACLGKDDLQAEIDEDRVKVWEAALKAATLVTCSTQYIADSLTKRLGVPTMVCPNAIDLDRFNIQKFPRNKQATVIGWAGGFGHTEALQRIAPAINKVLHERPDTIFVSIGACGPDTLASSLLDRKLVEAGRVADAAFGTLYQYPVMLSQFHIGLAPAVDNDFYRGKSDIRLLELAASYVYPIGQGPTYDELYHQPGPIGSYLTAEADPDAWADTIMSIIANPKERYMAGKRARKYIAAQRTVANTVDAWRAAIDRALEEA
jgi:glycosyltransferase involved in cell wall biosynthesis